MSSDATPGDAALGPRGLRTAAHPGERLSLDSVDDTHALAARLAAAARPGDVLALVGELGSGKTELTRGLARALGVGPDVPITSPSFTLLDLVPGGRLPLAHFDAYFMADTDDLERAGFLDLLRQGCLVVVEWADRVADALPADALWLLLEHGDVPSRRRATVLADPRDGVRPSRHAADGGTP